MHHLPPIPLASRTSIGRGYFTRSELLAIVRVYGRRVAMGDWRDYALDHLPGLAVFSIYRNQTEAPLFRVEKRWVKSRRVWQYALCDRRRAIKTAYQFNVILRALTDLPGLVQYQR